MRASAHVIGQLHSQKKEKKTQRFSRLTSVWC